MVLIIEWLVNKMSNFNNPKMPNEIRPNYTHQPLTIEHQGLHAKIKPNGRVTLIGVPDSKGEYDEIDVPASFIFKIASGLKMTRSITVPVQAFVSNNNVEDI